MEKDDDGRFSATRTDREVIEAVDEHDPAATSEVAAALDLTRQAADYRLRQLREQSRVESKKVGASLIWFAVDEQSDETAVEPRAEAGEPAVDGDLEARIRELDVPGSGTKLDRRVEATVTVVRHLESVGEASTQELKELLEDDRVGYASVESYWGNFVRSNGVLKQLPEVETPGKGEKSYFYTGR